MSEPEPDYFRYGHAAGYDLGRAAQANVVAAQIQGYYPKPLTKGSILKAKVGIGAIIVEIVGIFLLFPAIPVFLFIAILVPSILVVDRTTQLKPAFSRSRR